MKIFTFFRATLLALLMLCSTVATAHDFAVGGIYYNITSSTAKTVEVTYKDYYNSSFDDYSSFDVYNGSVSIPSTVTYSGIAYSVTSIGEYAFFECFNLTSVTIGSGVTSIEEYAFCGCVSLTSVTIGSGVTSIGSKAFYYCTGLTSVTIPANVTSIGDYAFDGCSELTEIYVESSTPASISSTTFNGLYEQATLYVPAGAKTAYESADYWKNFTIVESDFTSIDEIPVATFAGEENVWYDLSGRRVECPEKGIYILNGKKVIIK